ncbi:DNA primase [Alicyclobacillus cellulosilyticus]|uniref:DNA primase n=1 Tax=Alicyclobacillus cellulosilyticus TaxID=1003997 RepID=A0A917KDF6_9BACL|nr:DNA primase [Alicyclobacillus cellulosilyticus]GGJ09228.1 DNA primase [Alicyclobacillus cellulosilyticus]
MRSIPDTLVDEIRSRVDIVDVISEYVPLRRSGRSYVGLCPFHNERTPSFSVSPERQVYHCFGCGASGTVIRFLMDIEGIGFPEAVARLAERAGIELPGALQRTHSSGTSSRIEKMREAHELATKLYSYILMNTTAGVQALTYLEGRGLTRQTMAEFRLGYAPDAERAVVGWLERRGFDPALLVESGIAVAVGNRVVDRFRGRIVIPIEDARGRVIGFAGRALAPDGKPKYLNSPETPLFHKGRVLFNLNRARKAMRETGTAVLLEGYMDVLAAWQAGVRNVIAAMGTGFTEEQALTVARMANRLIIAYDGDEAGLGAAERCIETAEKAGLTPRVLWIPSGMDPDDWLRGGGQTAFRHLVQSGALTPVQFFVRRLRERFDLGQTAERMEYVRKVLALLAARASPVEAEAQIKELAAEVQVPVDVLREEWRALAHRTARRAQGPSGPAVQGRRPLVAKLKKGYIEAGDQILQWMLTDPDVCRTLEAEGVDELATPEQTALLARLYWYWSQRPDGSAADFLDRLEDAALRSLASSLMVREAKPFDTALLAAYLQTIRRHLLHRRYKDTLAKWKAAQLRRDADAISTYQSELAELRRQLLQWRLPPSAQAADAKEAGRT